MQSIVIRPANPRERQDLADIQVRVSLMWPDFRQQLFDDPTWIGVDEAHFNEGRVLVLEQHGETQGFAIVRLRDNGEAELRSYFIDPGTWGSDMPRRLMDAAADFARKHGAPCIWAQTTESAVFFYEANGFERAGEVYAPQGPMVAMRRSLRDTVGNA